MDLMKPRYKVIADYPYSTFDIGDILYSTKNYEWFTIKDTIYDYSPNIHIDWITQYPHLFKLLKWWEDRKPEEMPEYYKHLGNHGIFKTSFRPDCGSVMLQFKSTETVAVRLECTLPATEADYLEYQKQITHG